MIEGAEISGNIATEAGGILASGRSTNPVELQNSRLHGNIACDDGGAILHQEGPLYLTHTSIRANSAGLAGGGLLSPYTPEELEIRNCDFTANVATEGGGLAIDQGVASVLVEYTAVHANSAYVGAGLWLNDATTTTLRNVVVSENQATGFGAGIYVGAGTPVVEWSSLHGNVPDDILGMVSPVGTNGNVSEPPLWLVGTAADPLDIDLHLATTSLLIDAGNSSDLDPDGGPADMGPFGGPMGDGWDLDGDGYSAWWLPGSYDPLTSPGLDCDDLDPAVFPGSGC